MIEALVVCWDCYRITNRLEADVDHLSTWYLQGRPYEEIANVTSAQVAKWDNERNARMGR